MRTIKITVLAALTSGLLLSSCKYEEGPAISVLTKKQRVENTWVIDKALDNGEDVTSDFDEYTLITDKDGDAKLNASYTFGNFTYDAETNGIWSFEDSKESINFDYEDDDADKTYQILKLKSNEMWLREKGDDLELRLKSK